MNRLSRTSRIFSRTRSFENKSKVPHTLKKSSIAVYEVLFAVGKVVVGLRWLVNSLRFKKRRLPTTHYPLLTSRAKITGFTRFATLTLAVLSLFSGYIYLYTPAFTPVANAAANNTINFQARLLTNTGALVPDGYYNAEFKLYDAASGGTLLWTDTRYDTNGVTAGNDYRVQVKNGYLTVSLADTSAGGTAFPGTIDWSQELWLSMNIGGTTQTATPTWNGEMSPRMKVTAVPYAFAAKEAQQLKVTDSGFTTTISVATPTANRTITFADQSGTVVLDSTLTTEGDIYYRNGSGLARLARGSSGQCLTSNTTTILWGSCGAGTSTLQQAYDAGNTITSTDARDILFTLANTATDSNFLVNVATSSTGRFAVQVAGLDKLVVNAASNVLVNGDFTVDGNTNLNGATIATNQSNVSLLNATATTVSAFGAATSLTLGSTSGTTTVRNGIDIGGNLVFTHGINKNITTNNTSALQILGGDGTGTGFGGGLNIYGGNGGLSGGSGGGVAIYGGASQGGSADGGDVTVSGGTAMTTGTGGSLSLFGGWGYTGTANGGAVQIMGGPGGSGGNTNGGNVEINGGTKAGSGTSGSVTVKPYDASNNKTTFFQVQNGAGTNILNIDTTNGELEVGSYNGGTNPVNGKLVVNNSTNTNTVTLVSGATSTSYTLTLPTALGSSGDCLVDTTGAGVLGFTSCGGGGTTLQGAYDGDADGSDSVISLTSADDSLIFRNPASSGTDSNQVLTIDQLNTGALDALVVNNAGTGNILNLQDAGTTVLKVTDGGNITALGASTGTTGTTEANARTNVTTVTLTAPGSFANNDIIFINNAGQDYYTRIVSGAGTTTLTVSPEVSYDASATVTKYNLQNIGATSTDYTTQSNRFFQGYFLGGVVTGAGSTTLSDGSITSTNGLKLQATNGVTVNNPTDISTAFRILNTSGANLLSVGTSNNQVNLGESTINTIDDPMTSTPSGVMTNSATYITDSYIRLTDGGMFSNSGQITYTDASTTNYDTTFQYYTTGGTDDVFWFSHATSAPSTPSSATGGYKIAFNQAVPSGSGTLNLYYDSTLVTSATGFTPTSGVWHDVRVVLSGTRIKVYYDASLILDYTDISRSLTGTKFGLGAYVGGYWTGSARVRYLSMSSSTGGVVGSVGLNVYGTTKVQSVTNSTTAFQVQNGSGATLFAADTINRRLQVGSSTTDTTANLFVLDSYSLVTDPTGVNGAQYYNSYLNKFRCYQNGAWANCDQGHTIQDEGTDVTKRSTLNFTGSGVTVTDVVTSSTEYPDDVNASSPLAYWRFESGALTTDSSGNSKTLTSNGTPTETDPIIAYGGAVDMGNGDYYSRTDSTLVNLTTYTVEAWFKPTGASSGSIGQIFGTTYSGSRIPYSFRQNGSTIELAYYDGGTWRIVHQFTQTVGESYHLVLVNDNGQYYAYVNGSLAASYTGTTGSTTETGVLIGKRWDNTEYAVGVIDEAAIFNTVLSAATISDRYALRGGDGVTTVTINNSTLQQAYNISTGSTTPEIKLDATRGGLDVQDADTTIAGNLLTVRASNGAGLGAALFSVNSTGQSVFTNSTNSTSAFSVQNANSVNILNIDTTNGELEVGSYNGGTNPVNGKLVVNNSTNTNTVTLVSGATSTSYTLTLPTALGSSGDCLVDTTGAGVLGFTSCGGGGTTLQGAYDGDADGSDSVISLTSADDSLIFRNPASSGTDSTFTLKVEQLNTGAGVDALVVSNSGTGNILNLQSAGTKVLSVDSNGNLLGNGAATGTTGTTEANARTSVTSITLTTDAFSVNDVIFFNNAGQDYYTRITVDNADGTYTVSPAVSYDASITVTKYTVQNIGASTTDYSTQSNRFFQGYFLGGVVTGAGSTTLSDGSLTSTNDIRIQAADSVVINNTTNGTQALIVKNVEGNEILTVNATDSKVTFGGATTITTFNVIDEDYISTAPTGGLVGDAVHNVGNYVDLTDGTSSSSGAVDYTNQLATDFDTTFEYNISGSADAAFFYAYNNSVQLNEDLAYGGYTAVFDEHADQIRLHYDGTVLATATLTTINSGTWRTARVVKSGLNIKIYDNSTLYIDYNDVSRNLSGDHFGLGARSGALSATHKVRNFYLESTTPISDPAVSIDTVNGWTTFTSFINSATAFKVQNSAATNVFNVNTTDNQVEVTKLKVGAASTTTGSIVFNNSSNANTVTLTSGATSTSYELILPTAIGASGQCLKLGLQGQMNFKDCQGTIQDEGVAITQTEILNFVGNNIAVTSGSASTTNFDTEVNSYNPTVYLKLDDSSGTTAQDATANNNDGTYVGTPTLAVTGIAGDSGAVQLDGTNDEVTLPWLTAYNPTTNGLTISAWYKGTDIGSTSSYQTWPAIVSADTNTSNKRWALLIDNTGKPALVADNDYVITQGTHTVNDGNWHFIVATITASPGFDQVVYVDGELSASNTAANDAGSGSPTLSIGRETRWGNYLSGTVDNVAIYPSTLTSTNVADLFATMEVKTTVTVTDSTLQQAYNISTGSTTPEIKLDATRGGLDVQDADTTIAGNLLTVRASNGAGLGAALFSVNSTGQSVFKNSTNSTSAFSIQNANSVNILNIDTTNGELEVGSYNGGTNPVNGKLVVNNSTNSNTVTIVSGATSSSYTLTLPTALGASGDCLKDATGAGVLGFASCGSGGSLFTDAGSYTYLTSTTDDLVVGGSTTGNAKLRYDTTNQTLTLTSSTDTGTLGSELASNDFTNDWDGFGDWVLTGTNATHNTGNTTSLVATNLPAISTGDVVQVSFDVTSSAGTVYLYMDSLSGDRVAASGNTTKTFTWLITGTVAPEFFPTSSFNGTISNVSMKIVSQAPALVVKDVDGNSALQVRTSFTNQNMFIGQGSGVSISIGERNYGFGAGVLSSNTTGSFNNAFGYKTLGYNTTGNDNTAFGDSALRFNSTGSENTAVGSLSLQGSNGSNRQTAVGYGALQSSVNDENNTAIGWKALYNSNGGSWNTAIGTEALLNNSNGSHNVAIGSGTLNTNTSGSENIAIGSNNYGGALLNVTSGGGNIALGGVAGGGVTTSFANIAIGQSAMNGGTVSGNQNIALGTRALSAAISGQDNIAIGTDAGRTDTNGSGNVYIGYNAGTGGLSFSQFVGITNLHDAAAIGSKANVFQNDSIVIGATTGTNGTSPRIGIGTPMPINNFSAETFRTSSGSVSVTNGSGAVVGSGTSFTADMVGNTIYIASNSSSTMHYVGVITGYTDASNITVSPNVSLPTGSGYGYFINYTGLQVTSGGSVGIGTTTPGSRFTVGGSNTTAALSVQNSGGVNILNIDTTNGELEVGSYNGGTNPVNGKLVVNNSTNSNTVTIVSGATSSSYTLTLPTALGASGDCLKDTTGAGVLGFASCGSGGTTLQGAYDADTDGSDSIITLGSADDSLIFRNPASSGTDSNQVLTIDQLNTGAKDALVVNNAGTGNILTLQDAGTTVLKVTDGGNITALGASTGTTGTTEANARTNVTTVTLTAAGSFVNNDIIFINNAGQDYYTRIVSGGGTTTLTVSPEVSYDASATVTKYNLQNIGATSSDYTTQSNRFFQGYFLGGVVTGAGSTTLSDGNLKSSNGLKLETSSGVTIQGTNSTNALTVNNASGTNMFVVDSTNNMVKVGAPTDPVVNNYTINEDLMSSTPTGTLSGNASYSAGNYVQLNSGSNNSGNLEYNPSMATDFTAAFQFWTSGGADAVYFYAFNGTTPTVENQATGGYMVAFSEYGNYIRLTYNGTQLANVSESNLNNSTWRSVQIVKSGYNIKVYLDSVLKIDYTDTNRALTNTKMGLGARSGGTSGTHRVRNLDVDWSVTTPGTNPALTMNTSTGQTTFTSSTNGTSTFRLQDSAGTTYFNGDSTNQRIGINTTTPTAPLSVSASNTSSTETYGFEGGVLAPFTTSGVNPWTIDNNASNAYAGSYSVTANTTTNADLSITKTITADGFVSFYISRSSFFGRHVYFYIDGVQQVDISDNSSYTQYSYAVTAGTHTFKWSIAGVGVGTGVVRIDNITIPNASSSSQVAALNGGVSINAITTAPNFALDVNTGASTGMRWLGVASSTSTALQGGMLFHQYSNYGIQLASQNTSSLGNGQLVFDYRSLSDGSVVKSNIMTVRGDGNVGIGTASPAALLHVGTPSTGAYYTGFETGTLGDVTSSGSTPWTVTNSGCYAGTFCAINDMNNPSTLSLTKTLSSAGTISFWFTKNTWMNGSFKIDGVQQVGWGNGGLGPIYYSYAVSAGTHTFTWESTASVGNGDARVDEITVTNVAGSSVSAAFDGNVGIGTTSATKSLDVRGTALFKNTSNSTNAFDIQNSAGNSLFSVNTTAGKIVVNTSDASAGATVIEFAQSGTVQGNITINGATTSYNAFTGSHYVRFGGTTPEYGKLVSVTTNSGQRLNNNGEYVYNAAESQIANDPSAFGSFNGTASLTGYPDVYLVSAAGNGEVWIIENESGNISVGDPLLSSSTVGYAMKDPKTYAVSHIFAKAAQSVDWNIITTTVGGKKVAKISIFYSLYDQNNITGNLQAQNLNIAADGIFGGSVDIAGSLNVTGPVTLNGGLTVNGNATFTGDLTVQNITVANITVNGKIITAGNAPTVAVGIAAGSADPLNNISAPTVTITGNDTAGTITIVAGASTTPGNVAEVVFDAPFTGTPRAIISAKNANSASLQIFNTTQLDKLILTTNNAPIAGQTYQFDYIIVQ